MTHPEVVSLDGLQQAVDALAGRLGRSVAVDDTRGRLVVASRHYGDEDPLRTYAVMQRDSDPRVTAHFAAHGIDRWTRPGRIAADAELGLKPRICCPVRAHGIPFGHLFLIDEAVGDHEIELAAAVADDLGRLLHGRLVLHERDSGRRDQLTRDLVDDDPGVRETARRRLPDEHLLDGDGPVAALTVRPDAGSDGTALRVALERLARGRHGGRVLGTTTGRHATVLVFGGPATTATSRAVADGLLAELRAAGAARPVVGIGPPAVGTDAAHRSRTAARTAAEAAALLPVLGDVVGSEDLGVYAVLLTLARADVTADRLPAGLRRLLAHDGGDGLVDTLETYLDCCGDATRTAAALRIHRSTLYYRLSRIGTIGEVDLHDGQDRLTLHVGVKLRRLLDAYERDEPPGRRHPPVSGGEA